MEDAGPIGSSEIGAEGKKGSGFSNLHEHFFPSHYKSYCPPGSQKVSEPAFRELSYTESVQRVGPGVAVGPGAAGLGTDGFDESEEEAEDDSLHMSKLIGHAPGWTLMQDVYVYNGSIYVLTYVHVRS